MSAPTGRSPAISTSPCRSALRLTGASIAWRATRWTAIRPRGSGPPWAASRRSRWRRSAGAPGRPLGAAEASHPPALGVMDADERVRADLLEPAHAEQRHVLVDLLAHEPDAVLDGRLSAVRRREEKGAPDEHCSGAEREGFQDVGAPAIAAVDHDRQALRRGEGGRQDGEGRDGMIELAAAVIRQDHAVGA